MRRYWRAHAHGVGGYVDTAHSLNSIDEVGALPHSIMAALKDILLAHFQTPLTNVPLTLLLSLKEWYPSSQHVPVSNISDDAPFPLSSYLSTVDITANIIEDSGTQKIFEWDSNKKEIYADIITGSFKFSYEGTEFIVHKVTWTDAKGREHYFYDLITESSDDSAGRKLASDVFDWSNSLKKEIWVFQNGNWRKSKSLYKSIEQAKWDDIVLDETFKANLRRDTDTFFSSQEIYQNLGITWKRGILLLGEYSFLHFIRAFRLIMHIYRTTWERED